MQIDWRKSVFLVTSSQDNNTEFGTGFVIHQDRNYAYLVTCAHVVDDLGGTENIKVADQSAIVVAMGNSTELDLAVLRINISGNNFVPLILVNISNEEPPIKIIGYHLYGNKYQKATPVDATLTQSVLKPTGRASISIKAWDLSLTEEDKLHKGYSGSPVIDVRTERVLGVVNLKQGDSHGVAISVNELAQIWLEMPPSLLSDSTESADEQATIPFVIAAMTRLEAEALLKGSILDEADNVTRLEKKLFEKFKDKLIELVGDLTAEDQLNLILSGYHEKREDWIPLGHDIPIQEMIKKVFDYLYQHFGKSTGPHWNASFKRTASYFYDESNNKSTLEEFRRRGGVIVVDPISMFHPNIKDYLFEGCGTEGIGVIVVTPTNSKTAEVKQLLQQTAERQLKVAWSRFSRFDPLCEIIGIEHPDLFSRRLYYILSKMTEEPNMVRPQKDTIEKGLELVGAPRHPRGINEVMPGLRR